MKKLFILISLITLCIGTYSCGGGGAGPADVPSGESSGLPTVVQLLPVQYVAQTGTYIYLDAKVLDGNGIVMPDVNVTFTNLSAVGVLSSATAKTNGLGVATVSLYSTATGFATIQANINTAAGQIKTKKTVYFSTYDLTWPTSASAKPFISLYVDGDNDGIYNEQSDFTIFESSGDNQVKVLAVVFDGSGSVVSGSNVTFSSDSSTEVTFPLGSTKKTDINGTASVLVQFTPSALRTLSTTANITASADNGAASMVTLYLNPVTISSVTVSASPTTVSHSGTSTISASVRTSAGTAAPDGTTVSFTSSDSIGGVCGTIAPFVQTTSGAATATFTAPSYDATCTVTATSGGLSAKVNVTSYEKVTVTLDPLTIVPGSVTVASSTSAQTVTFTISGGSGTYTTTSNDPTRAYNSTAGNGIWTGSTIIVMIPANAASGIVTLNVYDSKGNTTSATLTIMIGGTTAAALSVSPSTITLSGIYNNATGGATESPANNADNVTLYVTGGTSPYTMYSSNTGVIPSVTVTTTGTSAGSFTIDPTSVASSTAVTLTVVDAAGATKTATVTVTPAPSSLAVNPSSIAMTGGSSTTFYIIGGVGPFTVVSGNTARATVSGVTVPATGSPYFTVTTLANPGSVTIMVIDTGSGGLSATSSVTVN